MNTTFEERKTTIYFTSKFIFIYETKTTIK